MFAYGPKGRVAFAVPLLAAALSPLARRTLDDHPAWRVVRQRGLRDFLSAVNELEEGQGDRRRSRNSHWPRSRSRLPQGNVASSRWARVGVEPLSGRDCWPQGQLTTDHTPLYRSAQASFATEISDLLREASRLHD